MNAHRRYDGTDVKIKSNNIVFQRYHYCALYLKEFFKKKFLGVISLSFSLAFWSSLNELVVTALKRKPKKKMFG
jgi:hypothetical protein